MPATLIASSTSGLELLSSMLLDDSLSTTDCEAGHLDVTSSKWRPNVIACLGSMVTPLLVIQRTVATHLLPNKESQSQTKA